MSSLQPHQQKIAEKRYFQGEEKTWDDLVDRIHLNVMAGEMGYLMGFGSREGQTKKYQDLNNIMLLLDRKFLFNTPTWINAGMPGARTLSACFVGALKDDMLGEDGILDCGVWFGTVQKFGGGTGIDLSNIRSKGSPIKSTHGKACGPVMVMRHLAATSQMITQGGARDGANMAVMSVYHEDIMEFISCKSEESEYCLKLPLEIAQHRVDTGVWTQEKANTFIEYQKRKGNLQLFNVSVAVDDKFMKAIQDYNTAPEDNILFGPDATYMQELPCGKTIKDVWNAIIEQAHSSGDPGLLFLERIQRLARQHSPLPHNATNPCGEQALPDHGSCNLGSIDLSKFIKEPEDAIEFANIRGEAPEAFEPWERSIRWDELEECISLSVRMLDNVVSINKFPVEKIAEVNRQERRIGLGIMGWADLLFKLRIPYDSDEAIKVAQDVSLFFKGCAHKASVDLAKERGAFPLWVDVELKCQQPESLMPNEPRRNATVTTIAPTGTISIMAGCSSGIEPHFMLGYEHKGLAEHGGLGYIWASDTIREFFEEYHADAVKLGRIYTFEDFEIDVIGNFNWKPANEIDIKWHIAHQAAWQVNIDNSISKTLNLPNSATIQDIEYAYILSYQSGNKGVTVYRDGCKPFQVLNASTPKEKKIVDPEPSEELTGVGMDLIDPNDYISETIIPGQRIKKKREKIVHGVTIKEKTGDGSLYVTINRGYRDEPFEVFATVGKAGGKAPAYTEALGRVISLALQYNIPIGEIARELRGISSGDPVGFGREKVLSVPDGIGKAIEEFMKNEIEETEEAENIEMAPQAAVTREVDACPECGSDIFLEEGCKKCIVCGYSKCS